MQVIRTDGGVDEPPRLYVAVGKDVLLEMATMNALGRICEISVDVSDDPGMPCDEVTLITGPELSHATGYLREKYPAHPEMIEVQDCRDDEEVRRDFERRKNRTQQ
jgi:hypothetical protein